MRFDITLERVNIRSHTSETSPLGWLRRLWSFGFKRLSMRRAVSSHASVPTCFPLDWPAHCLWDLFSFEWWLIRTSHKILHTLIVQPNWRQNAQREKKKRNSGLRRSLFSVSADISTGFIMNVKDRLSLGHKSIKRPRFYLGMHAAWYRTTSRARWLRNGSSACMVCWRYVIYEIEFRVKECGVSLFPASSGQSWKQHCRLMQEKDKRPERFPQASDV